MRKSQSGLKIDELALLVHPRDGHKRTYAMLEAYFDESGIDNQHSKICVVAGYYGGHYEWRRFESKWKTVLDKAGIEEFHSVRFWGRDSMGRRVKPFENWDDEKADKFLSDLLRTVENSRVFPTAHGIVVADWNRVPIDFRRWFTGGQVHKSGSGSPNKPYYLPFQYCVIDSTRRCKVPEKVHYFFDLDKTFSGYAQVLFRKMKSDPLFQQRDLLGVCSFPSSKDTPELQAADLLAYQIYQFNVGKLDNPNLKRGPVLDRLLRNSWPAQKFVLVTMERLNKTVSDTWDIYQELRKADIIRHGKARKSRGGA